MSRDLIENPLTEIGDRKKMAFLHKHGFSFLDISKLFNLNSARVEMCIGFELSKERRSVQELIDTEKKTAKPLPYSQQLAIQNFLDRPTGKKATSDFAVCNMSEDVEAAYNKWRKGLAGKWETSPQL